jgi:hypothetical protein
MSAPKYVSLVATYYMRTERTFLLFCNRNRTSYAEADAERVEKDRQLHFELYCQVEMSSVMYHRLIKCRNNLFYPQDQRLSFL